MVKGLQVQLSGRDKFIGVKLSTPGGLKDLKRAVQNALRPHLDGKDFSLTNFTKDVKDEEDVRALSEGEKLWAVISDSSHHVVPTKERVTFQPHPNTLTMAGELEYWAAQGRSPLPYAVSELIDNALRATRNNRASRKIVITLATLGGSTPSAGLISVWDNGCGMTKRELNDWAVMNLSMEDRGEQPQEPDVGHGPTQRNGPERFLSGNLSYFGVGSKNAAFFMGSCTKVVTKSAQSSFVHELSLAAEELEERYRKQQDVYAEDLVHRSPGDASTLTAIESAFQPLTQAWVAAEVDADAVEEGIGNSFTRVTIGQLKPTILRQIADEAAMQQLRRDLSHLYHYYLHGPQGSRSPGQTGSQPRDGSLPEIIIQSINGGRTAWKFNLADVTDDLESQYLQAQRAELQFSLMVPGKGTVAGALYYFPCQDERETLPAEGAVVSQPEPITTYNMTQQPMPSQLPTQAPPQSDGADAAGEDVTLWQRSRAPLFSAFWQGRLIPGARIESLPFIEAVRVKRSSASRDALPDEAFMRLRGSLFFGPAFLVTRNKLTFRDNLQELLASSSPGDRTNLERKFREWLTRCHATLDKRIRFVGLAEPAMQAAVRSSKGEDVTAFARIEDGSRTVSQGDVVRLNVKPAMMGMVLYFSVQQAVRTEGVYANGSVAVRPLPEEVHGSAAERTVPLRRLEGGPVQRQELDDYLAKELLKVPSSLRLEPIRLATGNAVELTAGASIPATGVTVLNGSGQHVIRGFLAGEKHSFSIVQRLWRLNAQSGGGHAPEDAAPAEEEPQRPPKKRKKPSKGKKAAEKTPEPAADMSPGVLIIEVHNHTPNKDCFRFERIENGLKKAGTYRLDYELQPCLPGKGPLVISTQLIVSSGPLACFDVQGEGRTLLASREFMLGEHLPSLQLIPRDGCGNNLEFDVERLKDISVEVVTGPTDDGSAPGVIQDLQASFQVAEDQGKMVINSAQVLGCNLGSVTSVFAASPTPDPVSIPQAQQQPASQQVIAAETVQLRFCVGGLEPQLVPVRLRPGAPVALRLLPGHPFSDQVDEAAAVMTQLPPERAAALALTLPSGGALPAFHVQAIDAWGNATGPTDALPCDVTAACDALSPVLTCFSIPASGRANVEGLVGASEGAALGQRVPLTLSIKCRLADADAASAVAAAGPPQPLVCALEVEPSTAPAAILLLHDGQPLPQCELEAEDGETETVFVVEDIAAGSELAGLAMQCVDAAGRPVPEGTPGKVRATWIHGTKKLRFGPDGTFALLNIRVVKEDVTEVETYDVKFKSAGPSPEVLEATLMVRKVPAAAHVWQLRLDEAASSQARSQDDVDMRSGCPFSLEVEALDRFGNRCPGGAAGALPAPLLSADSERKLEYDADAWDRSWSPQGSGEVLSVSVTLRGRPGLVRMHVRDAAGAAGSSALTPDTLELKLAAGPMTGLAFDGPPTLACGMRHVLPALRVIAVDDFGNRTSCAAFEVSLAPSALAADGSGVAAAITAPGGNKAKVKDGEAVFKNVRIEADSPGAYILRVKSASRKVAGDASVELQLTATNAVKALALREDSLPVEGCQAGTSLTLFAEVATEDEAALDGEAAAEGLALRLTPPGSGRSDDIVISPSQGERAEEQGIYAFCTEALVTAGEWTAVVEYTEQRPELSKALTKREAVLRSTAATFQVVPGPAVALALGAGAAGERLAATNGADARERLLLAGAALQLQDEHGNAAAAGGHRVRLSLHWPPGNQGGNGSELPKLEVEGAAVRKTDEHGRVFFGDVAIGEGSGRVAPDENVGGNARQGGAMELVLVAEVAGLKSADTKQWVREWTCSVLFSDNAASFTAVKELTVRHAALSAERDRLQERLSTTGRAAQAANKEVKARTKEVAECRRPLGRNAPETVAAAEAALSRLQNGAHEPQAQQPQVEARFGEPSARMTEALRRCLALEDDEVVGCVAQLATVSDGALARLLSASYRGMMPLLVTKTPAAQKRVTRHLAQHKCEVPDMLSMTMCAPFTGKDGASPGFDGASSRAKELSAAACDGTDPPLALPLPHTRILQTRKGGASSEDLELGATDWPEGCLGYAFNLLRPTQPGHRRQLMFSAFGTQLVFETLEDASKYREFVTQVLRSGMPQVVTLRDFRCITGIGVVRGTSWQVPTLEEANYRFGTMAGAAGSSGRGEAVDAEEAALEALLEALRAKEEAAKRHQAARLEAESTEAQYRGELEEFEAQIRELDAQLSSQHPPAGGARQRARKRRSAGEANDITAVEDVLEQNGEDEPQQDRRSKRRR